MAIRHRIKPRYKTRNEQIVADLRNSAGAGPPMDSYIVIKRKAAEISTAMALLHGGEWQVQIDHTIPLVLIRPV
ncbi:MULTISPECIES: hypothetical protein [unclassified Mesorhizobium]|uniref:hypothetical protein n=1 Tax=unclassified Mesorhizobium TaxID=325217 RepID=UPI001128F4DC|nr:MULTISPECIES: hypothetical protein [unclassified Mesorhizobium]TPK42275.1 hypothetical protein FJ550_30025 [Mesorhizobium sp. B2-5-2]TPL44530.1 hypothetical protein FJ961_04115 [Mesorhizobium sp. B2-4-5]TPM68717.1 hypothetical protein FJ968_29920 [Mesorhizobium sp. B2-1-6]TPN71723.1 hypothetical protein FJ985_30530 [Mesorhizobium sp. B1-1-2]